MSEERVAWVTGASRGIGRATALALANQGAFVIVSARTREALASVSADLGDRCLAIAYDVNDTRQMTNAFGRVRDEKGRLDVFVHTAGILAAKYLGAIVDAAIDEVLATNVASTIRHVQLAARLMLDHKKARS